MGASRQAGLTALTSPLALRTNLRTTERWSVPAVNRAAAAERRTAGGVVWICQARTRKCLHAASLWRRIHTLEEQIQDEKLLLEEKMRELRAQRDSSFHKAERTWRLEVEKLNTRLKMQQEENSQLSVSVSALSAQNRVLEKKVQTLVVELLETADTLEMERPKNRQWEEVLIRERAAWESERQGVAQLVEDLRSELGRLRRSDSAGQCVCPRSRWEESDMEKQRLAEENRGLRELNEELQDAVLTQSGTLIFLQPGVRERNRAAQGSLVHSIADEIEVCTKEQISALNEQKEINRRLRQYLDRVILSVLEKDPALLEIKSTI
ncbi:hypothetical protein FKM82_018846 [Ascaphus truei]